MSRVNATTVRFTPPALGWRTAMLWFLIVLFSTLSLSACGDDSSGPSGRAWRPGDDEASENEAVFSDPDYEILGINKKWLPIKDLFNEYAKGKIEALENPLQSHLVDHIEKPVIERKRSLALDGIEDLLADKNKPKGPPDPRTKDTLDKYKLIILMTGLSRPKAVVMGNGHRFVLQRGDPLGSEGGRIKAILQYKMLVSIPGESRPREVSIEPELGTIERNEPKKNPPKDS